MVLQSSGNTIFFDDGNVTLQKWCKTAIQNQSLHELYEYKSLEITIQ